MSSERLLKGIGVSPGCVVGPVFIVDWNLPDVPHRVVPEGEVETEIKRLRDAFAAVREHLSDLRRQAAERAGSEEAKIFDAQILMLEDPVFLDAVERLIRQNQLSAERAFEFESLELRAIWAQSPSAMLRQRRTDLFGVGARVLQELMGTSIDKILARRGGRPAIVMTQDLTPGLTVEFDRESVAGFISVEGTRTSHAAILAHSLGIPCVMGLVDGMERIKPESEVVLDGTRGTVLLEPTPEEIEQALERETRRHAIERELALIESEEPVTMDGVRVSIKANVDLPEELDAAVARGAEGVGLLRTEFMVIGRSELPDEEEQCRYFSRIAKRFPEHSVIVRSYDLGGDKFPAAFRPPREPNPFLGWRAIRVCLDQPEVFMGQIRALLRARVDGDVQLMLPLVISVEEVIQVKQLVAEACEALRKERVPFKEDLPIGVMIETPAAALLVDELASLSDFLSVGTNDLTQYVLAVDRGNAGLAGRFNSFHPAVVRLLKRIIDAGRRAQREVSVCGEMASEPLAAFLLLGMGYTVFSVAPPRMSFIRWLVRQIDTTMARTVADQVLQSATVQEVTDLLQHRLGEVVDLELLGVGQLPDP